MMGTFYELTYLTIAATTTAAAAGACVGAVVGIETTRDRGFLSVRNPRTLKLPWNHNSPKDFVLDRTVYARPTAARRETPSQPPRLRLLGTSSLATLPAFCRGLGL